MMNMGFSNAIIGEFNAYTFSLMGMLIVFIGQVLISLYIEWFPHLLEFIDKRKEKLRQKVRIKLHREKAPPRPSVQSIALEKDNMDEVMVAIATALHLEHGFLSDNQQYTWNDGQVSSHWKMAGKINSLSSRTTRSNW